MANITNLSDMSYNQRNLLLKIIEIQNIVIREQRRGVTQRWIFNNLIRDVFYISESTFNNYIARNAKKELAELNQREEERKKQLSLPFE